MICEADIDGLVSSLGRAELLSPPDDGICDPDSRTPARDLAACSGKGDVTPVARIRPTTVSSEAPSTALDLVISDGDLSLEVRWILPGVLTPEMIEWFGPSAGGIENRRDSYLVERTGPDVVVKLRGESQLDVKVHGGSPGVLTMRGQAHGRLGWWRKWSFPLPAVAEGTEPAGWASVQKVRRIRVFSLDGRPIVSKADATVEGCCAVELTDVLVGRRRWWTLGFEATGPAGSLTEALNASVAALFDHPLPAGLILDLAHSTSYSEWLQANWHGRLAPR